jgi:hypothetical protein
MAAVVIVGLVVVAWRAGAGDQLDHLTASDVV